MNKLLTLASVGVLTLAAAHVNAKTYAVSGDFVTGGAQGLEISLGGNNILAAGSTLSFGGLITSDGTNITGGTVTANGNQALNGDLAGITLTMNLSGTASDAGVLFDSGTVCVTSAIACDLGLIDVSVTNVSFLPGVSWGFFTTTGLQLDGTQTAPEYTVAQPGLASTAGPYAAAGAATLLGNDAGIFISGDIHLVSVPVPAAAWLFGSGLIGLAGMGRKRKAG